MTPFVINIPQSLLDDLKDRLRRTKWPDEQPNAGWEYGTNLSFLKGLVQYWASDFDWRKTERSMNNLPQFVTLIGGRKVHFVHVRGTGPHPFPLVLSHGWPSCFFEMHKIIGPLTDPARHGGNPEDSFDIVVPSLPGFAFSERTAPGGMVEVDKTWRALMTDVLGYRRFGAHGVDIGARVTSAVGRNHSDVVAGIHLGSVDLDWPDPVPADEALSAEEKDYIARVQRWERTEGAYGDVQATRPQTLAYGLTDSPAGLASWIVEKFRAWSECNGDIESRFSKDELLATITLYWATNCINPSFQRYFDKRHAKPSDPLKKVSVPTGIAMFPGERDLLVPRSWAERAYNVVHWTDMPRGGHFPAHEEPDLLVNDIRTFFSRIRRS